MTTNLAILATFTKSGGQPATGLTLAEISLYLTSINKATGVVAVIWDGTQVPTVEVTNTGAYARILATADLNTYDYVALARYTGATVLDSSYVSAATGQVEAIVMQMAADTLTAAALATDAVTEIQAGLSTLTMGQVNAEVVDALSVDTYIEPSSVPAATASIAAMLHWVFTLARNKITQTSTTQTLRNDTDNASIGTATVSDDGTTATRAEWQ